MGYNYNITLFSKKSRVRIIEIGKIRIYIYDISLKIIILKNNIIVIKYYLYLLFVY